MKMFNQDIGCKMKHWRYTKKTHHCVVGVGVTLIAVYIECSGVLHSLGFFGTFTAYTVHAIALTPIIKHLESKIKLLRLDD